MRKLLCLAMLVAGVASAEISITQPGGGGGGGSDPLALAGAAGAQATANNAISNRGVQINGSYLSNGLSLTINAVSNTTAGIAAAGGWTTNDIVYDPISTLATGATVTVTVVPSRTVYTVVAATPITLTNNLTALVCDSKQASWETWINYTSTGALSTAWDPRISWVSGTPDLTVTGTYRFAFSTADGTNMLARQTYPTVYPRSNFSGALLKNPVNGGAGGDWSINWELASALSPTNYAVIAAAIVARPVEYLYVNKLVYFTKELVLTNRSVLLNSEAYNYMDTFGDLKIQTNVISFVGATGNKNIIQVLRARNADGTMYSNVLLDEYVCENPGVVSGTFRWNGNYGYYRPANELEIRAYESGWRP